MSRHERSYHGGIRAEKLDEVGWNLAPTADVPPKPDRTVVVLWTPTVTRTCHNPCLFIHDEVGLWLYEKAWGFRRSMIGLGTTDDECLTLNK
jgi:hypothetical protein